MGYFNSTVVKFKHVNRTLWHIVFVIYLKSIKILYIFNLRVLNRRCQFNYRVVQWVLYKTTSVKTNSLIKVKVNIFSVRILFCITLNGKHNGVLPILISCVVCLVLRAKSLYVWLSVTGLSPDIVKSTIPGRVILDWIREGRSVNWV